MRALRHVWSTMPTTERIAAVVAIPVLSLLAALAAAAMP